MPSTTPYKIWLRGTDEYVLEDANSECATDTSDNFPTAIATPSVLNGWIEIGAYVLHPEDVAENDRYNAPGGIKYDDLTIIRQWDIATEWLTFPTDEPIREALYAHLRKVYLHFAVKTYEALAPQHSVGKVVAVNREYEAEHKDEAGRKRIPLLLTKRLPY